MRRIGIASPWKGVRGQKRVQDKIDQSFEVKIGLGWEAVGVCPAKALVPWGGCQELWQVGQPGGLGLRAV